MRLRRRSRESRLCDGDTVGTGDAGSASLEFIAAGAVLLVPIVYLIIALGQIQGHAFAVEAGARYLARTIATSEDRDDADIRSQRVLAAIEREYGMEPGSVQVELRCRPQGVECPRAGAVILVTLRAEVALPLVPPVLGLERAARVTVDAAASQKVARTWGGEP
ncbi:hypothetical protein AVP41_00742 [Microbacterium sp. TNHR37B]|nr:hypothetical protein AVP41_00742 [Microbacterium sp. TNHR37B]